MSSNSLEEIRSIASDWYYANASKNEASKIEAKTKKELEKFTESSEGFVEISFNGKPVNLSYGLQESVTEKINAKRLHEICKELGMEKEFWSTVSVGIGLAEDIFPETVLAKTKDSVAKVNWAIKKEK